MQPLTLGRIKPESKDVTIIGAGISGLLSAYYLDRDGYRVTLIEASDHSGGLIATRQLKNGIAEAAAHSIPASPAVRELFLDLGVELVPIREDSKARWIYRRGKFRRFPLSIFEAIRAFVRAYFVVAPACDPESLTLEEWASRFLGKAALKYLMSPFVRGIYGAEPKEILVAAAFPALCVPRGHSFLSFLLAKKIRKHPPTAVTRAVPKIPRGPMSAPRLGMGALVQALDKRLQQRLGDRFMKGSRAESVTDYEKAGANVILCVPAPEASRLLEKESPELSRMLASVQYSPLTTATILLKKSALAREPKGLGVLIPDGEGRNCLGVLFNSCTFPERVSSPDLLSLTMMLDNSQLESEVPKVIRSELDALFGLKEEPLEIFIRRWERAVPKYDAHLLQTWRLAQSSWCAKPGHILFGNYTGQVSIRGLAELARGISRTV